MSFGRKQINNKVMVLGVDGMDPRLTMRYIREGGMKNTQEFIKRGASGKNLILLGGHPTVTPPMWTTLATGCYANVHGITGFSRNIPGKIDRVGYNMDSRFCKAEQLWNVTAEAGLKTLVWHWPGSAWPPSSDNPNLMVVDGTSPGSVGMSTAQCEGEFFLAANKNIKEVTIQPKGTSEAKPACIVTDLEVPDEDDISLVEGIAEMMGDDGAKFIILEENQQTSACTEDRKDMVLSPILDEPEGWASAPAGAKEFTLMLSGGLIRRPALILQDDDGVYRSVAIYKSKKDPEPLAVLPKGEIVPYIFDDAIVNDQKRNVHRSMKLLEIAEDGNELAMYISPAMDIDMNVVYHPKRLYNEICENVGYPPPTCNLGCQNPTFITDCMLAMWYNTADWQANALHHLIESEDIDVIFSHFHCVDLEEHMFVKHLSEYRPDNRLPHEAYEKFMRDLYDQTDYYLGKFLDLLDDGWTIFIVSDHAQVASKYGQHILCDAAGIAVPVMEELGYTYPVYDENGKAQRDIDWTKTRAVISREGHVYLNIKGRDKHELPDGTVIDGLVDPADQYELEEQIMTDLYGYKDPRTGHRVVAVALRNRDAVLLGQGGPEAGDICLWIAEGYNFDHADSLSTCLGESETSVSPIFIAAGPGIKEDFTTDRIIRQVDVTPTVAAILGTRMPAQCEGAPAYQIFSEEF